MEQRTGARSGTSGCRADGHDTSGGPCERRHAPRPSPLGKGAKSVTILPLFLLENMCCSMGDSPSGRM